MSVAVVTALALAVGFRLPVAQLGPPPIVQPETYLSPSGRLELVVDPHDRRGRGPAAIRLLRDGTLVWERECDVTLVDARVLEDGSVAGYAYPGDLVLLFLGPQGGELARVRIERHDRFPHVPAKPVVIGFDLHEQPASVTFRFDMGRARHFNFHGAESEKELGTRVESSRARKPEVLLPTPEQPLELRELARVALLFTPSETSTRAPLVRIAPRTATISIHEGNNGALHVFGSDGRRNLLCLPDPTDPVRYRPFDRIDVDPQGHLHAYGSASHLWFGTRGERLGFEARETRLGPGAERHFLPSGGAWDLEIDRLTLQREGATDLVLERSAVGRWFQDLGSAAVSSDGVLSVIDRGIEGTANHQDSETVLQLFEPDGRPRATIPLPSMEFRPPLAAKPGECAVLDVTSRELLVLATDGSYSGRAPMPADLGSLGPITYSPDGSELWLVDRELVLHRFELRWK